MALGWIPMKQSIKVFKQSSGKVDAWGMPVHEMVSKEYKARIENNYSKKSVKFGNGLDVVFTATILLKGLVDVRDSDLIEWTDEFGRIVQKSPLTVTVLNDFSGKAVQTKVVV